MENPHPSPHHAAPAEVELRALCKAYRAGRAGQFVRHAVLRDVTLRLARGECVGVIGAGLGPITLLRCVAGLVHPDAGAVRWRDAQGGQVTAPTLSLVPATWAVYTCYTVRDALEAAVPPRECQDAADRRIAAALRICLAGALAPRRVAALPPLDRWRVGVAAAVASGATWLLLEPPPSVISEPARTLRAALLHLRTGGWTLIGAGAPPAAALLPATRWLRLADGRLRRVPGHERDALRVAERQAGRGPSDAWRAAGSVDSPPGGA